MEIDTRMNEGAAAGGVVVMMMMMIISLRKIKPHVVLTYRLAAVTLQHVHYRRNQRLILLF